jgi:competence protein ComFC
VHRIKYKRDLTLGIDLAKLMTGFIADLNWPIDLVIPVPLGRKRKNERGYNQVSLIAIPLAIEFGWKFVPEALIRIRETESQVGLNIKERHENVRDAFHANSRNIAGKNILLIDDVATTGATLSSCARALVTGGARNVYAITLARAAAMQSNARA